MGINIGKKMHCKDLEKDRQVIFLVDTNFDGKKHYFYGDVLWVNEDKRTVTISYLEGYKHRVDNIPYEDMVAAYDKDGEMLELGGIKGPSVLLTHEEIEKDIEKEM